jgi:CRP-like cAMP-binding protein
MVQEVIQQVGLRDELFQKLFDSTTEVFYKKGTHLVEQGQKCPYLFIVATGLLRMYYFDEKGNDVSHWFSPELHVMTDPKSFFENTQSRYTIEALEDTTVRRLDLHTVNTLSAEYHEIEHFARILTLRMFMELNGKLMDLQFKTAKERYLSLLSKHPGIINRVNLGHIASFIGITIQSLSRIRAEISH